MAFRDFLPFNLPFANDAARTSIAPDDPLQQILGHTTPAPEIQDLPKPRVGMGPYGQSGRANFWGLPEPDELNKRLLGQQGLRIFDEMYFTDPHIRRLVLMAWAPIETGTWNLDPHGGDDATDLDREVADAVWWMLTKYMSPNFFEHLDTLGPVLLRSGFCHFEQIWDTCEYNSKTYQAPRKLDLRLPRSIWRWWQDDFGELTHIGQILPNKADVIIPTTELCCYRISAEGDNWQGRSLLRHCYKPWTIKDRLERIDAVGQERKAVGVPVVYMSPDVHEDVRAALEKIVANMHTSEVAYLMVPGWKMGEGRADGGMEGNQFLVDVIQFDSSSGQTIQDSLQYHKQAIESSFAMDFMALGQHQVGARATAEIQEDPYLAAVEAVKIQVLPTLDRLIQRIVEVNWGDKVDGWPTLDVSLEETASLSEIAAYFQAAVAAEIIIPDPELEDWAREKADMPPANAEIRAKAQAARMAGLEQAANPPDPLELAKAKAQGGNPNSASAGSGGTNPTKPASAGKQLDDSEPSPIAGGFVVQANDTGRVLMIQRAKDKADDPEAQDRWEFPGGRLDGQTPYDGGLREWQEETGASLGQNVNHVGSFVSPDGAYQGYVVQVPHEADLSLSSKDPSEVKDIGWWDPGDVARDPRVRGKVREMLPHLQAFLLDSDAGSDGDSMAGGRAPRETVVSDFDGVIHPDDDHQLLLGPIPGAVQGLKDLQKRYRVIVCTARSKLKPVRKWLQANGLPELADTVTNVKPPAIAYIDNHAISFTAGGDGWGSIDALIDHERMQTSSAMPTSLLDKPSRPPHLRNATNSAESCRTCKMFDQGKCWGYGNWPVRPSQTCDSWSRSLKRTALDAPSPTPSARWFDRLLSQDKLKEAMNGAQDHITASVGPTARKIANQLSAGQAADDAALAGKLGGHYEQTYQLGHQTVRDELAKQRKTLTLDEPTNVAGAAFGANYVRAREKGKQSAQAIVDRISAALSTQTLNTPGAKQAALDAATSQLRLEALANTTSMLNAGRNDAAQADSQVVGAYYTSVMDERTCGSCEKADDGSLLSPENAITLGPPNPDCDGGDRCRCALVWVLSDDPSALQAVT